MKKARLFDALKQGFDELAAEREGKLTLHQIALEAPAPLDVTAEEIRSVRESVNVSQAVMARRLRVNVRTWQNWEQGKAKPNAQAAVLIKLVEKHPQTLELLEAL